MPAPQKRADLPVLQGRDFLVLEGMVHCRAMTVAHVASLFFDGRSEAAKKRISKLKAAGYVAERPRRSFERSVLRLDRRGFDVLKKEGRLTEHPELGIEALIRRSQVSDLTIRHELATMDCRVAFESAVKRLPAFTVAEFSTWPALHEFTTSHPTEGGDVMVRPDGFIRLHEKEPDGGLSEHAFFLEVDRSTETQDVLVTKARCYLSYYRNGGFAEKNGGHRSAFRDFPFRVLMVFKTAERRNNTAERLITGNPPILSLTWMATVAEFLADPFGPIWVRPADYRDAVAGTAFEPTFRDSWPQRPRQAAREHLVEQTIKKQALIQPADKNGDPRGSPSLTT